jgi:hypothetical protein
MKDSSTIIQLDVVSVSGEITGLSLNYITNIGIKAFALIQFQLLVASRRTLDAIVPLWPSDRSSDGTKYRHRISATHAG